MKTVEEYIGDLQAQVNHLNDKRVFDQNEAKDKFDKLEADQNKIYEVLKMHTVTGETINKTLLHIAGFVVTTKERLTRLEERDQDLV
jgi:DNA replication initiation complex subunit (GINS family)